MKLTLKEGQIINLQGYKQNGLLYRQWNGVKVLKINKKYIVLFMFKTKVLESDGTKWIVREPTFWFFDLKNFFNTTGLIRKNEIYFYTNIASPPIIEDNNIKFIDYDLDIKFYPKQKIKILDKPEFKKNIKKYNYSNKLIKKIEITLLEVEKLIEKKEWFFDYEKIKPFLNDLYKK